MFPQTFSSSQQQQQQRVYFALAGSEVKIGITTNLGQRISLLRIAHPDIKLLGHIPGGRKIERQLLSRFSEDCIGSEWFRFTPELQHTTQQLLSITTQFPLSLEWVCIPKEEEVCGFSLRRLLAEGNIKSVSESRSLAGVLRDLCIDYCVRIAPTNGQCGGFLHTTILPILKEYQSVYLGDWDLCGNMIEANTRR